MTKSASKSFTGNLEYLNSSLGWVIVRIPFDAKETWGSARIKVRGEVNGAEFRTTLFPTKEGTQFLLVNRKLQKAARILPGSTAKFQIEPDKTPRIASTPPELERIFKRSKKMKTWFKALSYSYRKWIADWIGQPKSLTSRTRRAELIAERILETREAEIALPPLLQSAFLRNPVAWEGWQCMTPIQRRAELFGIFYYRNPDGRMRRLQKTLELAARVAKRAEGRLP